MNLLAHAVRRRSVVFAALLALVAGSSAHAQSTYTGATSGAWTTSGNWTPTGVPTSATDVVLNGNGIFTSLTSSGTAKTVSIGAITAGSQTVLHLSSSGTLTTGGNITLASGSGTGELRLNGAATMVTINGGAGSILDGGGVGTSRLNFQGGFSNSLGLTTATVNEMTFGNSGTGTLNIATGQTYNAANVYLASGSAGSGAIHLNGGVLNVTVDLQLNLNANAASSYLNINSGTINGGFRFYKLNTGPAADIRFNNGTIGVVSGSSSLSIAAKGGTGTLGLILSGTGTNVFRSNAGQTITIDASTIMSDKAGEFGGFVKDGAGLLDIQTAATYTGATVVKSGTLKLSSTGSFANSSTITVGDAGSSGAVLDLTAKTGTFAFGSNQTVKGIGTLNIGTGKTVSSAGIWAPGNSIGSNAVTGNLALSGTSQFELGTPGTSTSAPGTSDFTAVSGTLTLGGNLTLLDNAGANGNGSAAGGVYRLFTYGNAVSGSYASVTTNPTATTRTSLSNISLGGSGTGSGQGVFLSIYNLAAGNVVSSTTVNFGTVLKNTSLSQALSITNTAPNNAYSEKLGTAFGAATGLASGSGSWSLLSAGGTSTALSVYLSSGSAGLASGSQVLNYTSDGAGSSGLSSVGAGSQTVNLSATILDPAVASFGSGPSATTTLSLDFFTVNEGDVVSPLNFSLYNLLQTAGYTADLALLSITPGVGNDAALTTNLATFNSLAAGSFNSWQASVNTANQGTFSNTWTLQFKSSNGGTAYSGDTAQTLTLTTNVIVVPEPGALAIAAAGIGLAAAAWARRRRA